jgi:hypothetical protein
MNLENRVRMLEEGTPGGYRTFDRDGNVVIDSLLPAREWFLAAQDLLRNGTRDERAAFKDQLRRSHRATDGGHMWEFLLGSTEFAVRKKDGQVVTIDWDDEPALRAAAQRRLCGEETGTLADELIDYDLRQLAAAGPAETQSAGR